MVDIHTHILPGVDDGAQTMGEALAMAEMALESGVNTIAATPHSNQYGRFENYASPELTAQFDAFAAALREEQLPLELVPGMEIYASNEVVDRIREKSLLSINGSRYYLVEFSFDEVPELIRSQLSQMQKVGAVPIVAHPERYFCVQDDPALVYEWLSRGCLVQVNKGSFFGRFGRRERNTAKVLLDNGLVTCVASDAHSLYQRTTFMGDIRSYLEEQIGERNAHLLTTVNPNLILQNQPIPPHGQMPRRRRRFFFGK